MRGGGLAIFFNNNLQISWKVRDDLSSADSRDMETLFVQIKQTNLHVKDVIIGVIYRPLNADFDIFQTNFSNILTSIDLEKRPTYLLGDFNIDLLKHGSDSTAQLFLNNLLSNGFYPRIDKPTRLTNTTATLIDNIFVNVRSDDFVLTLHFELLGSWGSLSMDMQRICRSTITALPVSARPGSPIDLFTASRSWDVGCQAPPEAQSIEDGFHLAGFDTSSGKMYLRSNHHRRKHIFK